MSEDIQMSNAVNQHYLEKVMDLAEEEDVAATEDIFNASGMKLIAKGAKISRALQEKLILHRLHKPLESCIAVEGGIDIAAVMTEARRISDSIEPVACILMLANGGASPFDIIAGLPLGNAMKMMLTIAERGGTAAMTHSVMVSLISICLAKKIGLSEQDQTTVALAGLLHDIGELYIDPAYLDPKRRLLPHEWRHVVVHPRLGQMLIGELETYPVGVSLAVAEHHERFDGAGYPGQLSGKNISMPGQILSVAEMISGIFMEQDKPLEHAALAMKIIPGEHASNLVSIVSNILRLPHTAASENNISLSEVYIRVRNLFDCISAAIQTVDRLNESTTVQSKKGKDLLSQVLARVHVIQRAFSGTGLDVCLADYGDQDSDLLFEVDMATKEIKWRLRDVARDLSLRADILDPYEKNIFQPLVALLDSGN